MAKQQKEPCDRLDALLASGVVWVEGFEYHGRASDGVVVNLGCKGWEARIESYLQTHPTPETW